MRIGLMVLAAGALGATARADDVVTTLAAFEAAVGGPAERLVTFDALVHETALNNQFAGIGFGGTGRVWDAIANGGGGTAVSPRNVVLNYGVAPIVMTMSPPAYSFATYNPSMFDRVRLTFKRANGSILRTIDMETGSVTFAGYRSDEPIATVEAVGIMAGGGSNGTIFLDNVQWSTTCVRVSAPGDALMCPGGEASFAVTAHGATAYRWQTLVGGQWCDLTDLQPGGGCRGSGGGGSTALYSGVATATLAISGIGVADEGAYRCVVTGACGQEVASTRASLNACATDFNCDGFIDFFDYDDFVLAFETGDPRADINADGFLDFFDYDDFVLAFEQGC